MIRNLLIVVVMGWVAQGAGALSLGAQQGAVWLGKPIDLGFEVQLDPGMSMDAACPQVRLVSGDSPVPAGHVQVTVQPGEPGRNPVIRVQSSHLADEPVLTAQVSIRCTGKVMREYTFLADPPVSAAAGVRPIAIPWDIPALGTQQQGASVGGSEPVRAPDAGALPPRKTPAHLRVARKSEHLSSVPSPRRLSGAATAVAPRRRGVQSDLQKAPPPVRTVAANANAEASASVVSSALPAPSASFEATPAAVGSAKHRLVVEPLAALVSSSALGEHALLDSAGSGEVLAVASTDHALHGAVSEGVRLQTLQAEIEHMRVQAVQDHQVTLALMARLERLNAGYFPAALVYGLLALLAFTMSAAAWGLMRMRHMLDASNEEWRNTLTACAAQPSLPLACGSEPERRGAARYSARQQASAAALQGGGLVA